MEGESDLEINIDEHKSSVKIDYGPLKYLYHGTSKENALKILGPPWEIRTESEIGYCGKGFYCYYLDEGLARIFPRTKNDFRNKEIAVLSLVVKKHNMFFLSYELYEKFIKRAKKITKEGYDSNKKDDNNKKAGRLFEGFIEDFQKKHTINIQTVSKYHLHSSRKRRSTFMFAIRDHSILEDLKLLEEK